MKKLCLIFAFLLFGLQGICLASPPPYSSLFGVIKLPPIGDPTNEWRTIASAFVCGPHKDVVTCAHVAIAAAEEAHSTELFYVAQGNIITHLKIKFIVPRYDIAVFEPDSDIPGTPPQIGDFKNIRPNDTIYYYGFDTRLSTPHLPAGKMNTATVSATGSVINDGVIVDFIEFEGEGIPGYSGGPVFNESGDLIAIMREAWTKQGVKGGPPILINRAFSIDMLRMQDEPIITGFQLNATNIPPPAVNATNKPNTSLLDALGFPATNSSR
jgi:S1-C subfamily serine protease